MFYVVFLEEFYEYTAIPEFWIRDAPRTMEIFMRNGINNFHTHLCYFNENAVAETNGEYFQPNFDLPFSNNYPCEEGIFYCRVVAFYG